jgi:hypothetical protein
VQPVTSATHAEIREPSSSSNQTLARAERTVGTAGTFETTIYAMLRALPSPVPKIAGYVSEFVQSDAYYNLVVEFFSRKTGFLFEHSARRIRFDSLYSYCVHISKTFCMSDSSREPIDLFNLGSDSRNTRSELSYSTASSASFPRIIINIVIHPSNCLKPRAWAWTNL